MIECPKIGEEYPIPHPDVFELVLDDHIKMVNPKTFGFKEPKKIDPAEYFITSGDAVSKAKQLELDLLRAAEQVDTSTAKGGKYQDAIYAAAGRCRALIEKLELARGTASFFETEWQNHQLLCIRKNPRKKD